MQHKFNLIFIVLTFISFSLMSQGITQTPYSQFGFGDIETNANARMMGMGGTGIGAIWPSSINLKNPAMNAYNRSNVIFEAGVYGQNLVLKNSVSSQRIANGNIQYLAISIPISKKGWTSVIGLMPYSNAHSRFGSTAKIENSSAITHHQRQIDGGLNQVFITNSFKLRKGFSIGLSTNYVFGTILRREQISLQDSLSPITSTLVNAQEIYRFIEFKPGISYVTKLGSKTTFSIGATMSFNTNIGSRRNLINSIMSNRRGFAVYSDTLNEAEAKASLPKNYGIGININRNNRWNIGVDYAFTDFSSYKSFALINVFSSGNRISVGGEFIPNPNAIRGYFNRIAFRGGAYYERSPLVLAGNRINDYGVSIGFGLPMAKGVVGSANIALMLGQRGTTENELIQENYFRFFLGLNINDIWFVRYKLD